MPAAVTSLRMKYSAFKKEMTISNTHIQIKLFFKQYFLIFNFLNLFFKILAALGLHCCTWAFSSCGEQRLLFIMMRGRLIAVASPVAEHGL